MSRRSEQLQQLRSRLLASFAQGELAEALCERDVNKTEAQLLVDDFVKEGAILETPSGLIWSTKPVEPLVSGASRKRRRGYGRPSSDAGARGEL